MSENPANVLMITDAARGKKFSNFMMAMALLKNYHPFRGPVGLKLYDLFKKFDKTWALTKGAEKKVRPDFSGAYVRGRH